MKEAFGYALSLSRQMPYGLSTLDRSRGPVQHPGHCQDQVGLGLLKLERLTVQRLDRNSTLKELLFERIVQTRNIDFERLDNTFESRRKVMHHLFDSAGRIGRVDFDVYLHF
jgi:hypothetical protein